MAQAPGHDRARRDIGEVLIFNRGLDKLIVAMDTDLTGKDGLVDQWFVLQTLVPVAETRIHLRAADVLVKDGLVRVTSHRDRKVYELGLEGTAPVPIVNARYDVVRTEGFGLAHHIADTTLQFSSNGRDDCADCESLMQDWGELGGGSGAGACDAGGIGASGCSLSEGTSSCSATCTGNYYACCRRLANGKVSCGCYLKE